MRRLCIETLGEMARETLGAGATVLDFAEDWIGSGKTILELSKVVSARAGAPISHYTVSKVINGWSDDAKQRIIAAREAGAHGLADAAIEITDKANAEKDHIQRARVQADVRLRVAEMWNRREFGRQAPTANVVIALPNLHMLAADRVPTVARVSGAPARDSKQALPLEAGTSELLDGSNAIPDAIADVVEIVSDDEA